VIKVALLSYACGRFSDPKLEFAPRWLAHHSRLFDRSDIYVVCNHVDETLYDSVNIIHRDHPEGIWFDVFWEMATTYEAIVRLRLTHHVTIFTSMDEFICTRKPIHALVSESDLPCQRLPTYDVIHDVFNEASLDFSKPTLMQRSFWKYAPGSTHPAILRSGLAPALGWHSLAGIEPTDIPFAGDALLAHFKREDYSNLVARTEDRQLWPWGIAKEMKGLSHHNKLLGDDLTEWFFQDLYNLEPTRTNFVEVP
jgi:hypothetical protein